MYKRLDPQTYNDECWEKVQDYINGVKNNDIVVGKYIKKLIKRYEDMLSQKDKYVYRTQKVDKVFKFFSFLNIELKNKHVQIKLMPWQCFFIALVFGFYYTKDPDKRVIRECLLFMARKNGKTAFAAALQMYGMLADGVVNPQSILLASVAHQAKVALDFAKDMIIHTPQLRERLVGQRSRIIFRDIDKQGFCQIFSPQVSERLEGYSPSMAILDEVHTYKDNSLHQAIRTGTGARINPIIFLISTAGSKTNGFLNEYLQYHKNILDGHIEDENTVAMIFQPDPEDDLSNPEIWCKANPSLGLINSIDDLKIEFNYAKHSIENQYKFITKILNIFYDTPETWIPEEFLLPLFDEFDETQFYGRDVYLGCDLSKNTDLSSVVVYIPKSENEEHSYVIPYFWIANMPGNVVRKSGKDLSNYIFDGHIIKCDSKTIDLDLIYDKIIELSTHFNIVSFQYDPYNSPVLISRLKEYGINCEIFRQNASKFNAPMKMLEELIYSKKIKFKNPCLLWNFSNVVLYIDQNANIKIVKNKQNDSVDGCVALAMSVGGWINATFGDEAMGINAYNEYIKQVKF